MARDFFGLALFACLAVSASSPRFVRGCADFERNAAGYDLAVLVIAQRSLSYWLLSCSGLIDTQPCDG
jgi:hypothetical protein